jgi:hypothetical protein
MNHALATRARRQSICALGASVLAVLTLVVPYWIELGAHSSQDVTPVSR